ncbi:unnamed protein product [Pleuronectes platessa]|uniref:Uncharacterized protein n=1 Tax=Pleuronectes platessa TaxID=8262 RepID=A0A9N7YS71_PLEPL|nr:unnamed protein product [Pleuronectes platessa]
MWAPPTSTNAMRRTGRIFRQPKLQHVAISRQTQKRERETCARRSRRCTKQENVTRAGALGHHSMRADIGARHTHAPYFYRDMNIDHQRICPYSLFNTIFLHSFIVLYWRWCRSAGDVAALEEICKTAEMCSTHPPSSKMPRPLSDYNNHLSYFPQKSTQKHRRGKERERVRRVCRRRKDVRRKRCAKRRECGA